MERRLADGETAGACLPWKKEMEEKVFLAQTASGKDVWIEEATFEHMKAHPDVSLEHIKEAIQKSDYEGPFKMDNIDLGRPIGKDRVVEVTPDDNVEHMYRLNRDGTMPYVDKEPVDTSKINVGICIDPADNRHTLFTAFYGELTPKEPWDKSLKTPEEKEASEKFWSTHAKTKDAAGEWKKEIDWDRTNEMKKEAGRVNDINELISNAKKRAAEQVAPNSDVRSKDNKDKYSPGD